jgi:hypothetical protein
MNWKTGGCHCGMVRFAVLAPDEIEAKECNCSICRRTGYLHLIVEKLTTYTFNTGTAKHHFCSLCGIKSFYVPRSKPDGFSVNVRCLDEGQVTVTRISLFDGQHWEEQMAALAQAEGHPS